MKQTCVANLAKLIAFVAMLFSLIGCGGGTISVNIPTAQQPTPTPTPLPAPLPTVIDPDKIYQDNLTVTPTTLSIIAGNSNTVEIKGGSGVGLMSATTSDQKICVPAIVGTTVNVIGVSAGNCTLTVTKTGDQKYLSSSAVVFVVVTSINSTTMVTTPTVVKTAVNGQILVKVSQPGEQYPLDSMKPQASNDSKVCSATWLNGNSFKVNGIGVGKCTIIFYGKDGTSGIIPVTVIAWMEDTISPTGWPETVDGKDTGYLDEVCDNVILDGVSTPIQNPLTELQTGITIPGSRTGCYKPSLAVMSHYPYMVYGRTDWERQLTKAPSWSSEDQCSLVGLVIEVSSQAYFAWQLQPSETCDPSNGLNSFQWGNYVAHDGTTWPLPPARY